MKFKNLKPIKKIFLILTIFILIASFFHIAWLSYKASFKIVKLLPGSYQKFFNKAHFQTQNTLANIVDSFYIKTYLHSQYAKNLKHFNLIMSQADINNIKADVKKSMDLGYNNKQTTNKQQIILNYDQKEYPARISLHGGGANNYIFFKTDYNVKLLNSQIIDGITSFTLFNPSIHNWIVPLLANKVAANLDLYFNQQYPVVVAINNKNSSIYLFEEKINSEFLKNRQLLPAQVIKLRDETRLPHRINTFGLNAHHLSGFDFEIANIDTSDESNEVVLFTLNNLFKAIKDKKIEDLSGFFDLDYMARYDAYREFFAINHDTAGDNLMMFYSQENNKFYPIVRNEGDLNKLAIKGGTTLKSFNFYDSHLEEQYDYPRLFLLLHRNSEFRVLKYKYLNQLITQYSKLQKEFEDIYDQYADIFIYDTTDESSVRQKKKLFNTYLKRIDNNYNLIKKQFAFSQIAINIINNSKNTTIEIIPDSVMPIKFENFELEFSENIKSVNIADTINQKTILAEFSEDFDLIPTTYSYIINTPAPVSSVNIKAKNQITEASIDKIYIGIATN